MAQSASGITHWYGDGLRIDFTGATPQYEATPVFMAGRSGSSHGYTDASGNLMFHIFRHQPQNYDLVIHKPGSAVYPTLVPGTMQTNGELNVIPFPCPTGAEPNEFLIIYQRRTMLSPDSQLGFVVYNHANHTITPYQQLNTSTTNYMGAAVTREQRDASGNAFRYLYFADGTVIKRAKIDFTVTNGWYVEQNPTTIFTPASGASMDIIEMELTHQGDKLAWISTTDNDVHMLDLTTSTEKVWNLGGVGVAYLTGLEWSPNGNRVFINRHVTTYPHLSGIAMYDFANSWTGWKFLNPEWCHSQIEYAYDGYLYVTNGDDLLRMDPVSLATIGIITYNAGTTGRTFGITEFTNSAGYASPANHQNYRFPDQVDGEVMIHQGTSHVSWALGSSWCNGNDTFTTPDDIVKISANLLDLTAGQTIVYDLPLQGNTTYDLTDIFPQILCGTNQYIVYYTVYPKCGSSYGTQTYPFTVVCNDTPTISKGMCAGSPTTVTATNVPSGATVRWYNSSGTLINTGATSLSLVDGDYTITYTVGSCVTSLAFSLRCAPLDPGPIKFPRGVNEEMEPASALLYPNPVQGNEIYLPVGFEGAKVQAYDMTGREMQLHLESGKVTINNWKPGVYLFHVEGPAGEVLRQRILVTE